MEHEQLQSQNFKVHPNHLNGGYMALGNSVNSEVVKRIAKLNHMNDNVSIEWESTGYSVLKNLNASVLGIFCEFIDNSIQSYREKRMF